MESPVLPEGLDLVRTTDVFDNESVPVGLLRAHRVASGVWGRLVVYTGSVTFVFEDETGDPITVHAGDSVVIPPDRLHHVELYDPATFVVEFHRAPRPVPVELGRESSGLGDHSSDQA
jgi:tellurite resistance-related uncharacterized protein